MKKTTKKDSDPDFEQNLEEMTCHFERMMDLLDDNQKSLILPDHINRVGLNENLFPVELGFTGNKRNLTWEGLSDKFADDRNEATRHQDRTGLIHRPKNTNYNLLKISVTKNASPETLFGFSKAVTGDAIHDAFKNNRPGSCMRYEKCQPWQKIYVNNPDDVDVIVFGLECGLTGGRSSSWLRWKGKHTAFFDKAYYDSDANVIEEVRKKIGPLYGVVEGAKLPTAFRLKWIDSHRLPYMDTFIYAKEYDEENETIVLSSNEFSGCTDSDIVRNHEFGWHPTREPDGFARCANCNATQREQDILDPHEHAGVDSVCICCARSCAYYNGYFPSSSVFYHAYYVDGRLTENYISIHALENHFVKSCFGTTYVKKGEEITLACGSVCSPSDIKNELLVVKVDGELRKRDECVKIKGEWFLKDDCVRINYVWYNKTSNDVLMDYETGEWKLLNPSVQQEGSFYRNTKGMKDYNKIFVDKEASKIYNMLYRSYPYSLDYDEDYRYRLYDNEIER